LIVERQKLTKKVCPDCGESKIVNRFGICLDCDRSDGGQLPLFVRQLAADALTELSERIKQNDNTRQAD
jgi:hypothetical protein